MFPLKYLARKGLTSTPVTICCLVAPSHHLNQCCGHIISKIQWQLSEGNFRRDISKPSITKINFKVTCLIFHSQLPVANEIRGKCKATLIARFMGPTWGPSGADGTQVGPMLAPWTLLSGQLHELCCDEWHICVSQLVETSLTPSGEHILFCHFVATGFPKSYLNVRKLHRILAPSFLSSVIFILGNSCQ